MRCSDIDANRIHIYFCLFLCLVLLITGSGMLPAFATDWGDVDVPVFTGTVTNVYQCAGFQSCYSVNIDGGGSTEVKVQLGGRVVGEMCPGIKVRVAGARRSDQLNSVILYKPTHYIENIGGSCARPKAAETVTAPPAGAGNSNGQLENALWTIFERIRGAVVSAMEACMTGVALKDTPDSDRKLTLLRSFRDKVLAKTQGGRAFIACYYKVISPPVVKVMTGSEPAKWLVRWTVVEPIVAVTSLSSPAWDN
jgi:hypothetical protein